MNTYITSLLAILCLAVSCKSSQTTEEPSTLQKTTYTSDVPAEQDCYYPRKTITTVTNQLGTIAYIVDTYIITTDGDRRYQPCDIPKDFCQEGLAVVFSGEKLEINPNERRFASPFRLRTLTKVDN